MTAKQIFYNMIHGRTKMHDKIQTNPALSINYLISLSWKYANWINLKKVLQLTWIPFIIHCRTNMSTGIVKMIPKDNRLVCGNYNLAYVPQTGPQKCVWEGVTGSSILTVNTCSLYEQIHCTQLQSYKF